MTIMVIYLITQYHSSVTKNNFNKMSVIYKNFDYDKYPDIKKDQEIIIILTSIKELYDINPVEFRVLLRTINEFLHEFSRINTKSLYKDTIYSRLKQIASYIINIYNSFSVNLKYNNANIGDLNIDTKVIETNVNNYSENMIKLKNWLSKKLTEAEIIINDKWLNSKININSIPIYPDDVEGLEYKSDNYNVY